MPFYVPIAAAVLVGLIGRKTVLGFWGNFVLSLIFTPIVPLAIFVVISLDRKLKRPGVPA